MLQDESSGDVCSDASARSAATRRPLYWTLRSLLETLTDLLMFVVQAPDYIDHMGYGYVDEATGDPVVTDSLLQGGIVSVYYLGTLGGCLLGGWVGDKVGRIKTVAFGAIWAIVGASLQCSAMNPNWMICARAVNGIGTGILNAIVPVWATETAEHTSRGQFIAIEFTLNIFGVVVAYWLEYGLSFIDGGQSPIRWRFPVSESVSYPYAFYRTNLLTTANAHRLPFKSSLCLFCSALCGSFPSRRVGYAKSVARKKLDTSLGV